PAIAGRPVHGRRATTRRCTSATGRATHSLSRRETGTTRERMTTASTPIIPDYAQPTAAGGFVTQTLALFVDAYRELNAKKLFWIVLILSVVVVAGFATMGINERGVTLFKLEFPGAWNTNLITKGEFYKMLFVIFAIPIWLAWL